MIEQLTSEQILLLQQVPAYITLLIGTADDAMDSKEAAVAKQAVAYRIDHGDDLTKAYFREVSLQFDYHLADLSARFISLSPEARTTAISNALASVSPVLGLLDIKLAYALLESWRGLARAVAQASGSIIGSQAVSHEEMHLMGLNMIEIPR